MFKHRYMMVYSKEPIRLAFLEADNPPERASAKYGSYGGTFVSLFHKALDASPMPRSQLEFTGWDVVNADPEGEEVELGGMYNWKRKRGYPSLDEVDAVLITGSRMWVCLLLQCSPAVLGPTS